MWICRVFIHRVILLLLFVFPAGFRTTPNKMPRTIQYSEKYQDDIYEYR